METKFAEVTLLGPRGEIISRIKTAVTGVVMSRDTVDVTEPGETWRQLAPSRYKQWSLHLFEDTKREDCTHFCGSRKSHGFHFFAGRNYCDGYNAEQAAAEHMVKIVLDTLAAENVPPEVIDRIRNRLLFGHPSGGGWISQEKVAEMFAKDLLDEKSMRRMVNELMGVDEDGRATEGTGERAEGETQTAEKEVQDPEGEGTPQG